MRNQLDTIIQPSGSITKPEEHLDKIYIKVLTTSIPDEQMPEEEKTFINHLRYMLGSMAALFSPLPVSSLSTLLSHSGMVSNDDVEDVLNLLHAVLDIPVKPDRPLRLHHPSFRDFLMDKSRCKDARFWVDEKQAHQALAYDCIRLLSGSLTQDICKVDAYGTLAAKLPKGSLEQFLPPHLQYACLFWIQHVQNGSVQLCDDDHVHRFLLKHFLHWLEALGWMGKLAEGIDAIQILESIITADICPNLYAFIHDMKRFALYSRAAIEQAPLQVYFSGLVFAPDQSLVKRHFMKAPPQWIKRLPVSRSQWGALRQTLEGHCSTVSAVAFSRDARILASVSWDRSLRLWDVSTGIEQRTLCDSHSSWIRAVAFSPDGKVVASGSDDKTIKLWDAATGDIKHILHGHSYEIAALTYSSDGMMLASASYDTTINIWDPSSPGLLRTLQGHSDSVNALAFSPDCRLIVSASDDQTVKVWDLSSNDVRHTLNNHAGEVYAVAFSPTSQTVASGSEDRTIILWDTVSGTVTQTLKGHSGWVSALAYSSDGKILASASFDNTIKLWDPSSGAVLQSLNGHTKAVRSLAFADDTMLASSSEDKMVKLWKVDVFELSQNLKSPVKEDKEEAVLLEKSSCLSLSKTVTSWDARLCLALQPPKDHFESTTRVTFSGDGNLVAVALENRSVEVWNVYANRRLQVFKKADAVAFAPNGNVVVVTMGHNEVLTQLWDVHADRQLQRVKEAIDTNTLRGAEVSKVALSPDGKALAVTLNVGTYFGGRTSNTFDYLALDTLHCQVKLFGLGKDYMWSRDCIYVSRNEGVLHGVGAALDLGFDNYYQGLECHFRAFSPNGKVLAVKWNIGTIDLVDTHTGTKFQRFSRSNALAFSPDSKVLAVALGSGVIRILSTDPSTPEVLTEFRHTDGGVAFKTRYARDLKFLESMAFSPNGKILAVTHNTGTIDLVDTHTGTKLQQFSGADALAFSPDSKVLAVALDSGVIRLFNTHSRTLLRTLNGYYTNTRAMVFSPDSKVLAVTLGANNMYLLDTSLSAPLHPLREHWKRINALVVSPNGRVLASASDDKTVKIRSIATNEVLRTLEDYSDTICALAFSPDSTMLAVASVDTSIRLWDSSLGPVRRTFESGSRVYAVVFSPDGKVVASACADKTVKLWDIDSGVLKTTVKVEHVVYSLSFSLDGSSLETSHGTFPTSLICAEGSFITHQSPRAYVREQWIASVAGDMLWLPPEYRSKCVTTYGNIVVLGFLSGRVAIFEFAF